MKQLVTLYLRHNGVMDRVRGIQKSIGINPLNFDLLSLTNFPSWYQHTLHWIAFLEDPYFQKRVKNIRKDYAYKPHFLNFLPLFDHPVEKNIKLLKMLDEASLKACDAYFIDGLLSTTYPPEGGPYFDLLIAISEYDTQVPIQLIHPIFLNLGLQFSRREKDMSTLSNITKHDIAFLALFLSLLAKDQALCDKLITAAESDEVFSIAMFSIAPEHKMSHLEPHVHVIETGLKRVSDALKSYEKSPKDFLDNFFEAPIGNL